MPWFFLLRLHRVARMDLQPGKCADSDVTNATSPCKSWKDLFRCDLDPVEWESVSVAESTAGRYGQGLGEWLCRQSSATPWARSKQEKSLQKAEVLEVERWQMRMQPGLITHAFSKRCFDVLRNSSDLCSIGDISNKNHSYTLWESPIRTFWKRQFYDI